MCATGCATRFSIFGALRIARTQGILVKSRLAGPNSRWMSTLAIRHWFERWWKTVGEPAGHVIGVPTFDRSSWGDSHHSRIANHVVPLNQPVSDVNADSGQCNACHKHSHPRNIGARAVEVIAETIAESDVGACIETGANRIKGQERDSPGARSARERLHHRVQTGDELGDQQEGQAAPAKEPAMARHRIGRESTHEAKKLVSAPAPHFIPDPVRQYAGHDGQADQGGEVQLPGGRERPGSQQKQRGRHWEPNLPRK